MCYGINDDDDEEEEELLQLIGPLVRSQARKAA